MAIIKTKQFGRTGHLSSHAIFGPTSLSQASQNEANQVLELLLKYGINHIDAAPRYGEAEIRIGPWMKHHGDQFFLTTQTDQRKYGETRDQF